MAEYKTLLAHLAPRLGSSTENIAVEALGHILSTSKAALGAIEDLLKAGGAEVGTISPDVRTQASDEERTRPDLAGCDEHGVERVLIEAKFWAGLTERQPVTYLERLATNEPSVLLFVAPRARFEPLWSELRRRVVEARIDFVRNSNNGNLWTAEVGGERRLMLISWKSLLERMASRTSIAEDSRMEADIRQLLGLIQRMDEDAFLPLRSAELGPEVPRLILGLRRLLADAVERVRSDERVDMSGRRGNPPWYRYMRLAGAGVWFGISFELWALPEFRDTPLWLIIDDFGGDKTLKLSVDDVRRRLAPLRQEDPHGIVDEGNRLLVPISLPFGVEYDTVLDAVVKRFEYIAHLLDSSDAKS
ncbi:MAG: hypothetical protein F4Z21_11680 [Acidobacteria bacterium]|nr:hypothetical protein [Acidobacteriota bacterium]